ncbi:unnamed protein product [Candidula unifasciata]|uniref:Uncharacterized protein n=1 Tax=Candidula unifasciata TaxID=100452 RepID=A0A8S3ZCZ8_9EUPU|nr:unnamed protein product [Candidula unifasciata]
MSFVDNCSRTSSLISSFSGVCLPLPKSRIRCSKDQINVGGSSFQSASDALLVYLHQYDVAMGREVRVRRQDSPSDLLLSGNKRRESHPISSKYLDDVQSLGGANITRVAEDVEDVKSLGGADVTRVAEDVEDLLTSKLQAEVTEAVREVRLQRGLKLAAPEFSNHTKTELQHEVEVALLRSAKLLEKVTKEDIPSTRSYSVERKFPGYDSLALLGSQEAEKRPPGHVYSYHSSRHRKTQNLSSVKSVHPLPVPLQSGELRRCSSTDNLLPASHRLPPKQKHSFSSSSASISYHSDPTGVLRNLRTRSLSPGLRSATNHSPSPELISATNHSPSPGLRNAINHSPSPGLRNATNHSPSPEPRNAARHSPSPELRNATNYSPSPELRNATNHSPSPELRNATSHSPSPELINATNHSPSPELRNATSHSPSPELRDATNHLPSPELRDATNHLPSSGLWQQSTAWQDQSVRKSIPSWVQELSPSEVTDSFWESDSVQKSSKETKTYSDPANPDNVSVRTKTGTTNSHSIKDDDLSSNSGLIAGCNLSDLGLSAIHSSSNNKLSTFFNGTGKEDYSIEKHRIRHSSPIRESLASAFTSPVMPVLGSRTFDSEYNGEAVLHRDILPQTARLKRSIENFVASAETLRQKTLRSDSSVASSEAQCSSLDTLSLLTGKPLSRKDAATASLMPEGIPAVGQSYSTWSLVPASEHEKGNASPGSAGLDLTSDGLDGDRPWEKLAVTFKPPVPVEADDVAPGNGTFSEQRTLSGRKQPGSMETLKNMLFKLQAEESSTHKENNKNHEGLNASQTNNSKPYLDIIPSLQNYDFQREPGGQSLEKALVHLNRLKELVQSTSASGFSDETVKTSTVELPTNDLTHKSC